MSGEEEWLELIGEDLERVLEATPKVLPYCETDEQREVGHERSL